MFDLKSDPHEMTSVYGQPEFREAQAMLVRELAALRQQYVVPEVDPPASRAGGKDKPTSAAIRAKTPEVPKK